MTIAASLVLIAIGAILKFAITATVSGVNIGVIGIILMVIGVVGFIIALVTMVTRHRTDVVSRVDDGTGARQTRTTYYNPRDPGEPGP
jgi:membrane-bound ClpP family serine protease